ncbi:hypothetical protein GA0115240_10134 [Streptomyces sp. DvalAA-14]|uniref:hypothetical protein n=1 Tax=unclassified Streptomyces TaxID=2593676 RepID=UPI00081B0C6E|nr:MULTISPECIES: hypothetical protein [unclassified Streptomyces]MYS18812.1 hypothetical protein [Streptomyces sp. SID4948]SCD29848.1 hypothetical protein GA0115240_10134 [Streptomyces sp. DvalAA-14]
MPRPTNAQVASGLSTVVLFTFLTLLLSGARSGPAVAAVAAGGMVLGLLVAAAVTAQRRKAAARAASARSAATRASAASLGSLASVPRTRLRGGAAEHRVGEHSLRR